MEEISCFLHFPCKIELFPMKLPRDSCIPKEAVRSLGVGPEASY
jgi:hypothetical protein